MVRLRFLLFFSIVLFPVCLCASGTDSLRAIINTIVIRGNTQTKVPIILRELTFAEGDTVLAADLPALLERSRQNLMNTALFNLVSIGQVCMPGDTNCHVVLVEVAERWYTWPTPLFEVAEPNINTWWRNGHNLARASVGGYLIRNNFRGRRETVTLKVRVGYAPQFGLSYQVPYLNRAQTLGLTVSASYAQLREVAYRTERNTYVFYKDVNRPLRTERTAAVALSYRKGLYLRQSLELRLTDLRIADTVRSLASDYLAGGGKQMNYFSLSWRAVYDDRDYRPYPLRGQFAELEAGRIGLGLLRNETPQVTLLVAGYRRYVPLSKRWFAAASARVRWMPGAVQPYVLRRAMGSSVYVRGYQYYVVDGQSYVLAKTALRWQVLPTHTIRLPWLPLEKFNTIPVTIYAGVFADAAYVEDRRRVATDQNRLGNAWHYGYGAGLDLVSYYDIVCRAEYAFNSFGEGGLFLHAIAAF